MIRPRFGAVSLALVMVAALLAGCSSRPRQVLSPGPSGSKPGTGHVEATTGQTMYTLRFGAGVPIHIDTKGSNGADTTSSTWTYSWEFAPSIIQMDSSATIHPDNFLVLLGTRNPNIDSTVVSAHVLENDPAIIAQLGTNLVATVSIVVHFLRAPDRNLVGDIRLYHITQSAGGVLALQYDTVEARFLNQDGLDTPLPGGILSVAGDAMIIRNGPDGQDYHGQILFAFPGTYDVLTPGILKDPHAYVPKLTLTAVGPDADLTLTSPDQRHPVIRSQGLSIQWTGGVTLPVISSFEPDFGKLGTKVRIHGRNFVYLKSVNIGGVPDPDYKLLACDEIEATVPANAKPGPALWSVVNQAGTSYSANTYNVDTVVTSAPQARPWETAVTSGDGDPDHCPIIEIELRDAFGHVITLRALDSGRYDLPVSQLQLLVPGMIRIKLTRTLLREFTTPFQSGSGPLTATTQMRFILEHHASFFLEP